jgi:hypothetical protein
MKLAVSELRFAKSLSGTPAIFLRSYCLLGIQLFSRSQHSLSLCGTRMFITVFTTASRWSLSSAGSIQSTFPHPTLPMTPPQRAVFPSLSAFLTPEYYYQIEQFIFMVTFLCKCHLTRELHTARVPAPVGASRIQIGITTLYRYCDIDFCL